MALLASIGVQVGSTAAAVSARTAGVTAPTDLVDPWVHSSGTGFVDASGNPVYLRGFDSSSGMGWSKAAGLGANFVRVLVYWSDLEPNPPVNGVHMWDAKQLAALDLEVTTLESQHVNVLIDAHQSGWSPYFSHLGRHAGRGMPAWLYGPDYFPQPPTYYGLGMARVDFATNPAILQYYEAYLQMLVERYRSHPNVVGYEVYNEPQPGRLGVNHAATQAMIDVQGKMLQFVRSLDPVRTVFLFTRQGGDLGFLNADISSWGSLQNVAIDTHDYFIGADPPLGYRPDTEDWYPSRRGTVTQFEIVYQGTEENQFRILDQLLAKTNEWGVPLLVGEWGARIDDANLAEYQRQMLDVFRQRKLSWARFALTSTGPLGILNRDGTPTGAALQIQDDLGKPY